MSIELMPLGLSVSADIAKRRAASREFREASDRLRPFEELARVVIVRRAELGLSQLQLADRMKSTKSVISRIESGRHPTNTQTLGRLAEALGGHAVVGFQFDGERASEFVRL